MKSVKVTVRGVDRLKRREALLIKLPTFTMPKAMEAAGKDIVSSLILAATAAGIKSTEVGGLANGGIHYEQAGDNLSGIVFGPLSSIYLDSMRPHFVSITNARPHFLAWARAAEVSSIRTKAESVAQGKSKRLSLFVRPHPFIDAGLSLAESRRTMILEQYADEVVS